MRTDKKFPVLVKRKEECCGCTACYSICPMKAINMEEDDEGFAYPILNKEICICCYKCVAICPLKNYKSKN